MSIRFLSGINVDSNTLFVDSTNNRVGIGTASPTAALHIVTGGSTQIRLQHDSWNYWDITSAYNTTNADLYFSMAGAEKFRINASGNVGIGTTSPAVKFVVSNAGASGFEVDPTGGVGGGPVLQAYNRSTSAYMSQSYYALSHTFNVGSGAATRAVDITSAGNVGIGTTSPSYKLDVYGDIRAGGADPLLILQPNSGTYAFFQKLSASNGDFLRLYDGTTYSTFWKNGNVGIGITNPLTNLHVVGTTEARVRVSESAGASLELYQQTTDSYILSSNALKFYNGGSERMRISSAGALKLSAYGSGSNTGTATQRLAVDASGNVIEIPIGSGPVDGNGTANFVTKWSDADTITNSQIFDNGTSVGVGTTSPAEFFHIRSTGFATPLYIEHTAATSAYLGIANSGGKAYIYSSSNDLVFGTTASVTERMRITSAGNVGIGTTSPGARLSIQNSGTTDSIISEYRMTNGSNAATFRTDDNVTFGIHSQNSGDIYIKDTSDNVLFYGKNGGNVGIGTTSPGAKLDVSGNAKFGGTDAYNNITINNNSNTGGGGILIQRNGVNQMYVGALGWYQGTSNSGAVIGTDNSSYPIVFYTNVERMRITGGGNVGIGTTSPAGRLSVEGDGTEYSNIVFKQSAAQEHLIYASANSQYNLIGSGAPIWIWGQQGSTERMRLNNTGLGIGTDTPTQKLHVTGNVRVTGAYYDSNNSAGTSGQVLSSTGSGTDWVSLSEITGVDGTGTANYVAKWSDTDTITNSQIRDDGTTVGIGQAPGAAKLSVETITTGGETSYGKSYASLDTTGVAVAGLNASSNGQSAMFTFTCYGGDNHYQRVIYSCKNDSGTWYTSKVIDEGTNGLDVTVSANGSTITFTYKSRSGTQGYSPRILIQHLGSAINTTYL